MTAPARSVFWVFIAIVLSCWNTYLFRTWLCKLRIEWCKTEAPSCCLHFSSDFAIHYPHWCVVILNISIVSCFFLLLQMDATVVRGKKATLILPNHFFLKPLVELEWPTLLLALRPASDPTQARWPVVEPLPTPRLLTCVLATHLSKPIDFCPLSLASQVLTSHHKFLCVGFIFRDILWFRHLAGRPSTKRFATLTTLTKSLGAEVARELFQPCSR